MAQVFTLPVGWIMVDSNGGWSGVVLESDFHYLVSAATKIFGDNFHGYKYSNTGIVYKTEAMLRFDLNIWDEDSDEDS